MENSIRIEIYSNSIKFSMLDCSSSLPLANEIPSEKPLLWTIVILDSGLFIRCNGRYAFSKYNEIDIEKRDIEKRDISCLKSWVAKFSDSLWNKEAIRFPEKNALSISYRSKPSGIQLIGKWKTIFMRSFNILQFES